MAAFSHVGQCPAQRLKRFGLAAQFLGAGDGEGLDLGAGTLAVAPQPQQTSDILDRKAEVTGIGDEPQTMDIGIRIVAIAAVPALRRRDQTDLLIMADHPLREDRKSVVSGKSVSVRVDLGGSRLIKNKNPTHKL